MTVAFYRQGITLLKLALAIMKGFSAYKYSHPSKAVSSTKYLGYLSMTVSKSEATKLVDVKITNELV